MSQSYWRGKAKTVIWQTLKDNGINSARDAFNLSEKDKKRIIKAVSDAYPFGQKTNHPYKCWCSEKNDILEALMIKAKPQKKQNNQPNQVLIDDPRQGRFC
jgi:hypothetical protein